MEDKREKIRCTDSWNKFTPRTEPPTEEEMEVARKRARLSVLNLTERDKRFLSALKIQPR